MSVSDIQDTPDGHKVFYANGRSLHPHTIHIYADRFHFWRDQRLTTNEVRQLRSYCRFLHLTNERSRFDPALIQLVQVFPEDETAVEFACRLDGHLHLNYAEIACDLIFATDAEAKRAAKYIRKRLRWFHGKARVICGNMASTGRRWENSKGVNLYADRHSKIDGQLGCCHVELQLSGHAVFKRLGIEDMRDFANVDLQALLQKHITLVDVEQLGILYRNHHQRLRDKQPTIRVGRNYTYNESQYVGAFLIRNAGGTMQHLLQERSLPPRLRRRIPSICTSLPMSIPTSMSFSPNPLAHRDIFSKM